MSYKHDNVEVLVNGKLVNLDDIMMPLEPVSVAPEIGSRWCRPYHDPSKGPYNGYTVFTVTNTDHPHENHPAQVVYRGDNGLWWSLPLDKWPGNLIEEVL